VNDKDFAKFILFPFYIEKFINFLYNIFKMHIFSAGGLSHHVLSPQRNQKGVFLLHLKRQLKEKTQESLASVLPITAIVLILSITVTPLDPGTLILFLFGAVLLVFGMSLFTLGTDMSMIPMGEGMGISLSQSKRIWIPIIVFFLLGAMATIAEPDLQVLAEQIPSIENMVLILTVAIGVGIMLVIAALRVKFGIPLRRLLLIFYLIVFTCAFFTPNQFIPVSFDSGGVTTGPVTVPFIMALGIGIASLRQDENSSSDSFGLIALCSVGPILATMLLGIFYQPDEAVYNLGTMPEVLTTMQAAQYFFTELPHYFREVAIALLPIALLFFLFQVFTRRFHPHQLIRMSSGLIYTYLGLVLFLCGVNVGFLPAGQYLGATLAASPQKWLLIPIGMLIGYFIVRAEPAVAILTKQVEEISNGSISHQAMGYALSIGVCISVGLAMVRVLTGLNIMWVLIPGYVIALGLSFFVPPLFTGIAFDSGGVASGPMTATFLLPFAMGACSSVGGNIMTDAFGIVAFVAMTPLVTIQCMGLYSTLKHTATRRRMRIHLEQVDDVMVYFN